MEAQWFLFYYIFPKAIKMVIASNLARGAVIRTLKEGEVASLDETK